MEKNCYYKKITAEQSCFSLNLGEIWLYRELIWVLTKRSFIVRYRQTLLGPLWLFFSTIFHGLLTFLIFGGIAHLGTGNVPPLLFYLTGSAVWGFFSGCISQNADTFRSNSGIFSKVYFPRLCMSISYVLSDLIDFCIRMTMPFLLLIWYCCTGVLQVHLLRFLLFPVIMLIMSVLSMSIGIFVSSLTTKYRDFQVLLGFGLALWMPLTPVAYPLSEISNPVIRILFDINPITGMMELLRYSLFGQGQILIGNLIYGCIFTMLIALISVIVFHKVERSFSDTI